MGSAAAACRDPYADCCRTARGRSIGGSRRAQDSGIPGSEADHSGDGTDSNRVIGSVRSDWQGDHERREVEQVPEGIQMCSWLALSKALTDRQLPTPCPTPTDFKAIGSNGSDALKFYPNTI